MKNQHCIDAATAEVKKEEKDSGSADNPDAVHSNSREQTAGASSDNVKRRLTRFWNDNPHCDPRKKI